MLSDVCLTVSVAYIGPKSRKERRSKTKIGTEVAHVTRDSDTTFKDKGHEAALLTSVLAHQAAAAMDVGNCCYVAICLATQGTSASTGGGEGRGHIVAAARLQHVTY